MFEIYYTDKTNTRVRATNNKLDLVLNSAKPGIIEINNDATKTNGFNKGHLPEYKIRTLQVTPITNYTVTFLGQIDGTNWVKLFVDVVKAARDATCLMHIFNEAATYKYPVKITITPVAAGDEDYTVYIPVVEYGSNYIR